jgi:hypothetical protein
MDGKWQRSNAVYFDGGDEVGYVDERSILIWRLLLILSDAGFGGHYGSDVDVGMRCISSSSMFLGEV